MDESRIHDNVLDRIAHSVEYEYITRRCQAQQIERPTTVPASWKAGFMKIAELCITHGINPDEFMEVQFFALKPWPEINMITTSKALNRFAEARRDHAIQMASKVMLQLAAYERLVQVGNDPKEALLDPDQGFDDLFIYIAAAQQGMNDVADAYFQYALSQYVLSTHYDGIYKDAITDELKEAARSLKEHINGSN